MILAFLKLYWKQAAIALILMIVFLFGYYKGYSNQKQKFDAFKLQVEVNAKVQKDKNELLVKKQKQITDNVTKEYSNAVDKLNAYYANRMLKYSSSSRVSKNTSPTTTTDAKTESDIPSTTGDIALDCASDVLQLLYLQEWINNQLLVE